MNRMHKIFRPESKYRAFFLSVITVGLAYGLYKGVIDNYLGDHMQLGMRNTLSLQYSRKGCIAFVVCCVNYILDSVISLASMASNVYVQDISDSPEEVRATISTGVSVNHLITILIALFGGWIWETLGIETLFILSAVLGLCNSAYAATIKVKKKAV